MEKYLALALCLVAFLSALISTVYAGDESIVNQFLGSPLLALAVIIIIVIIAFVYRRIRK